MPRALIADDDVAVLGLLQRWVTSAGYETRTYSTFEEARRAVNEWNPDLLVTDVRLGDFNGLQLVLEAKDRNPAVVPVVITGFDDSVLRADSVAAGAKFLVKPLGVDQFLDAIKR